jgi:FlaG/FlaF family flagellin (archaellin)
MPTDRAVTPLIGNILLVSVAIVLGVTLTVLSFAFLDGMGAPTAEATFEYEESPAGLRIIPEALGTDVDVKLNGERVTTLDAGSAGQSVLLPTAPDDRITIVSKDGEKAVFIDEEVDDRSEVGDLIAMYTFEESAGSTTLTDEANNGNDATLSGDASDWTGRGYSFDGDDHFQVTNLNTPVPQVSEFTFAVSYRADTATKKMELAEHISGQDNWGVEIKECGPNWPSCTGSYPSTYNPNFFADQSGGSQTGQIFGGERDPGDRHVIVGTYDGTQTKMYVDGTPQGTRSFSAPISMGDFTIGSDGQNPGNSDNLEGDIFEIRLYYTAMDDSEVQVITNAMD